MRMYFATCLAVASTPAVACRFKIRSTDSIVLRSGMKGVNIRTVGGDKLQSGIFILGFFHRGVKGGSQGILLWGCSILNDSTC